MVAGDWREFRAKLIQRTMGTPEGARRSEDNRRLLEEQSPRLAAEGLWAHSTPLPEAGGLLLASLQGPQMLGDDRLWQTVVFVVSHSPEEGSVGLILNRPTGMVLGRKQGGLPLEMAGSVPVQRVFHNSMLYCGGFTAQQVIHLMHGHRLEGSVQVCPGVFLAGEAAATSAVEGGRLPAADFKFFAGALTWGPGELEAQVAAGAWYPAACSRSLVLKPAVQLPVPLWKEVLRLMGGLYAGVAAEGDEAEAEE
ncbi:hypothetical protein HYH03_016109 [Edaphochlamys debaryana]|uniref:Transcriptional regulator n=1 Tax=Edaphochlamys debaryana TaxID=47281 RepID=A0A835XKX0_9CHLO|nr:hypothetical protein HYH03_016109 [Edaphochlamys debaryana]|eukprot:KAG2485122.1 hypothetical protein HYH03_016109 [Edaphochlamys debaryana]